MNLDQRTCSPPSARALRRARPRVTLPPHRRRIDADVAIVGSGFTGSLAALALRRARARVVLIERGRHPRFAIGESSTPLANLLLEELADRYDLPRDPRVLEMGHLAADASGRRLRPQARLHVLLPSARRAFADDRRIASGSCWSPRARTTRSPTRTGTGRTSIRRSSRRRKPRAPSIWTTTRLERDRHEGDGMRSSRASATASPSAITAGFVIDASGPRGFLHRALGTGERAAALAAADAGALHALRRRRALGSTADDVRRRRRIRSTMRRCITCFPADGSGCCASTTASPAPARR